MISAETQPLGQSKGLFSVLPPSPVLELGRASDLAGPGNSGELALLCLAAEGVHHRGAPQTPPTALGHRPIKGFLSFSLSFSSLAWLGPPGKLFSSVVKCTWGGEERLGRHLASEKHFDPKSQGKAEANGHLSVLVGNTAWGSGNKWPWSSLLAFRVAFPGHSWDKR